MSGAATMDMELTVLFFLQAAFRVLAVCSVVFLVCWVFLKRDRLFRSRLMDQPSPDEPQLPREAIIPAGRPIHVAPLSSSREDVA